MVAPADAMHKLAEAVATEAELPNDMSVVFHEADTENDDANESMPLLEIQIVNTERPQLTNDDRVGFKLDDRGYRVARIYESNYELTLEINIWTAGQSGNDPNELGEALRRALYPYSSHGPGLPLDDDIFYVTINEGGRNDDLIQTPTVRRWSQEVEVWACEQFRTDKDPVDGVSFPDADSLEGDDGIISS